MFFFFQGVMFALLYISSTLLQCRVLNKLMTAYAVLHNTMHIYPTPPLGQDMTHSQFLTGLNSEFSFS